MNTGEAIKNELKVAIPFVFLYKKPSSNERISYTLVSLINHDGNLLDCGHYVSDIFDANTSILWHCDDNNITQISDFTKRGYIRESHNKMHVSLNIFIICCLYQDKSSEKYSSLKKIHQHVQNQSYEESN